MAPTVNKDQNPAEISFWRQMPSPVWLAIWLFFLPPVNLINLIRLIGYTKATDSDRRDPNYSAAWMLVILSLLMTVVVILTIIGLYLLLTSDLLPSSLSGL